MALNTSVKKYGILLVNLGTPDAPTTAAVKRYLAEFLTDPRVIDVSPLIWKPILYGAILPFVRQKWLNYTNPSGWKAALLYWCIAKDSNRN